MPNKRNPPVKNQPAQLQSEPGLSEEQLAEPPLDEAEEVAAPPRPRPPAAVTASVPLNAAGMTRNLMFCVLGLVLGFAVGVFLANKMVAAPSVQTVAAGTTQEADGTAPPLDPSQTTGQLPPGHPDIGAADGQSAPAASDADAQQAMAAADAKPKEFDLQMNAAAIFYKAGDYDKAELYLQRALEAKPKDVDALTAMGNTKYDKGDFNSAADYYQRVLVIQPQNADVQTDLGNAYFRRTPPDYQRAIAEYRKTLAIDPQHEKALQNIAAAALQLKDKETARKALDQLAGVNPNNAALASMRTSLNELP
jgi:Tfp pilus assembly protein PilF